MAEGVEIQMPHALRRLFATILLFFQPRNPCALWENFFKNLSEDYRKKYPFDDARVLQLTTQAIESYLEGMGKSFKDFNLHHLHALQTHEFRQTKDIYDALNAPIPEEYVDARKKLNIEQRVAYKCIVHHVKNEKPGAFFIDGPGGTGKTFLYSALYAKIRQLGKIVLPTATSGIAASNISSGRTAHSRFKIPLENNGSISCDVPKQSSLAQLLKKTALVIWDEASMAHRESIEALDLLLRDLCTDSLPFGGKTVVFGGDFRQVLPVLPKRTQQEAVEASLVSSHIWPILMKFTLTQNVRAQEDLEFSRLLLNLGNGDLQNRGNGLIELPHGLMIPFRENDDSIEELTSFVFPEIQQVSFQYDIFNERAILTPKNEDVDMINQLLIDKFPGETINYKRFDSILDDNCVNYPVEFLNTLCPGGMSPHNLILKRNCPVILLRNLDPANGLCNGTRLICKHFCPNTIQCEIATGYYKGQMILLPRITLKPSTSLNYPFHFERRQFPIKLSFAMTINKAQGQTLQRVGVYLRQPCFSHGQLYVALSRAKRSSQLKIVSKPPVEQPNAIFCVRNFVSFEILKRAHIR